MVSRIQPTIVERLLERHRVDSERMFPPPSRLDLDAAELIQELESDYLRRHKDACDRWTTIKEIELISDNCVNAERYGAEEALIDLQAIRSIIKRAALQQKD